MKYESLMQYPMGVDYALAGLWVFQENKVFPYKMYKDEFLEYLQKYRRDDPIVDIPLDEIPDILRFHRPDRTNLTNSLTGRFLMNTIDLEWMGFPERTRYHRKTGPATVRMFKHEISFNSGHIQGLKAIRCNEVLCKWYQRGIITRMDGPMSVNISEFTMDRVNNEYENPCINWDFSTRTSWDNMSGNDAEKALRKHSIRLNYLAVHESSFRSSEDEYLFREEVNHARLG